MNRPCVLRAVGRISPDPKWRLGWQSHAFSEMIVVLSGRFTVWRDRRADSDRLELSAGDCVEYPAGCDHREASDQGAPAETIFCTYDGSVGSQVRVVRDRDGRVRTMARWLWESRAMAWDGAAGLRQTWFAGLAGEFERLESTVGGSHDAVERARAFMRDHLREPITLEMIANASALSKYHFVRVYREACGHTPMADLRLMRLEHADHLRTSRHLPLKAVAPLAGFASAYHLSRCLSKYLGRSARGAHRTRPPA